MASSARIEELEKKFNENPRRYFAPLANEYRKAGDIDQAIAICRTYVPQQPAHMSGHIVFGQALFEAGQHDEARSVFEAALGLDPENLIALRHLGDIARARGENDAARTWYRRVLDADPRNEEVAALIMSLDGAPSPRAAEVSQSWMEINPERTLELPPGMLESASRETVLKEADLRPEAAPAGFGGRGSLSFEQMLQPPPPTMAESGWPAEPPPPGPRVYTHSELTEGVPGIERPPEPPSDAFSGGYGAPTGTTPGLEPMEFTAPQRPPAPAPGPGEAVLSSVGAATGAPGAFVTETMAELYLQQGFREEALGVYRQLLFQSPSDPVLRERVEQLEGGARPGGVADAVAPEPVVDARAQWREAPSTRSIRAFFGQLATRQVARPGSETGRREAAADEPPTATASQSAGYRASAEDSGPATSLGASSTGSPTPFHAGGVEASHDPYGGESIASESFVAETYGAGALAASVPVDRRSGVTETDDFSGDSLVPRSSSDDESVLASFSAAEAVRFSGSGEYELSGYQAEVPSEAGVRGGDMVGSAAVATPGAGASEPLVSDRSSTFAPPPAPASSGPSSEDGSATRPSTESRSEERAVQAGIDNGARSETDAPPEAKEESSRGSGVSMQTGSVNVLFPQQQIAGADEAAAQALSGAFGGPSQDVPGARASGRAARPAISELSLDSVFRETPPPSVEPRRESSAFSFDQFFGGGGTAQPASETQGSDSAPDGDADASLADAEQFSNWLAGLKKK